VGAVPALSKKAVPPTAADTVWIGVQLDEPLRQYDGSAGGVRYFACKAKFGAFARPSALKVGDYPEEDIDEQL